MLVSRTNKKRNTKKERTCNKIERQLLEPSSQHGANRAIVVVVVAALLLLVL